MSVCVCVCVLTCMWKPEDNLWESVFFFHLLGPGYWAPAIRLRDKYLYPCLVFCRSTPWPKTALGQKALFDFYFQVTVHHWGQELKQELKAETMKSSLLPCSLAQAQLAFLEPRGHLTGSSAAHSGLGSPASIHSQANPSQTCPQVNLI